MDCMPTNPNKFILLQREISGISSYDVFKRFDSPGSQNYLEVIVTKLYARNQETRIIFCYPFPALS